MPGVNDLQAINEVESVFSIFIKNKAYAGMFLMPPFLVDTYSGEFWKYNIADAFITSDLKRAADGTASELDWKPQTDTYTTSEKAKKTWMSDRNELQADEAVRPSRSATFRVVNQMLLGHDKEVAAIATSTSIITQNVTLSLATQKYTDLAASDPLGDFSDAKLALKYVPYAANVDNPDARLIAVTTPPVVEALRVHPDILGMFVNTDGPMSLTNLAEAMGVSQVIVAEAMKDVSGTPTYIYNNDIIFAWVNPSKEAETMTFGATVMTRMPATQGLATGVATTTPFLMGDAEGLGIRVRDYREEKKGGGGAWREADAAWGLKVILPQLAYLIKSAV